MMFEYLYYFITDKDFYAEHLAQFFLLVIIPAFTFWLCKTALKEQAREDREARIKEEGKNKEKPWHGGYDL